MEDASARMEYTRPRGSQPRGQSVWTDHVTLIVCSGGEGRSPRAVRQALQKSPLALVSSASYLW